MCKIEEELGNKGNVFMSFCQRSLILSLVKGEALYIAYKNDVIQYKLLMIGQYTDKITNVRPLYILIYNGRSA